MVIKQNAGFAEYLVSVAQNWGKNMSGPLQVFWQYGIGALLLIVVALLAGCGPAGFALWHHPHKGDRALDFDSAACQKKAEQAAPQFSRGLIFSNCMKDEGWREIRPLR